MGLLGSVLQTIRRHQMLPQGGRVVVALSGGPDSVALLHILRELETSGELVIAGIAHFNHRLRGDASEQDERFCREAAAALGITAEVGSADVREAAREQKRSIEDAARRLRYAFLNEAAARLRADAIAVGHSRDDQAETFLLRLLRGSGSRGLGGIRPKNGNVIRPLIDISRAELRQFAAERSLSFREDETNADVSMPRNRIRHELLPYLQRELSPNIVELLAREAALAREDDERLQIEAIELASSIVLTDTRAEFDGRLPGTVAVVSLDADRLRSLHPALRSRVARIALEPLAGGRFVGFEHVQRFLEFAGAGAPGSALSLPGQQARHDGRFVRLQVEPDRRRPERERALRVPLPVPGEVVLAEQGWTVLADFVEGAGSNLGQSNALTALVRGFEGPLGVRTRRPGDRFQPPGLGGRTRKLQDYLVDRKVPRSARDRLPLVVDRDDKIVWIVGHAVAEGFRAAEPSPGVILLIARHLGGEV